MASEKKSTVNEFVYNSLLRRLPLRDGRARIRAMISVSQQIEIGALYYVSERLANRLYPVISGDISIFCSLFLPVFSLFFLCQL